MNTARNNDRSNRWATRPLAKLQRILAGTAALVAIASASPIAVAAATSTADVRPTDADLDRSERTVLAFYTAGLVHKNYAVAAAYLGPEYIRHHPDAKDGKRGFQEFVAYLKAKAPRSTFEYKQIFSSGDYVILHILYKPKPTDRGDAIVDIFRLAHGKIVEHWDVIQPIPEKFANPNTMF